MAYREVAARYKALSGGAPAIMYPPLARAPAAGGSLSLIHLIKEEYESAARPR